MLKNRAEGKTKLTREFGSLKCIEKGVHTVSKKKSGGGETPKSCSLDRSLPLRNCGKHAWGGNLRSVVVVMIIF